MAKKRKNRKSKKNKLNDLMKDRLIQKERKAKRRKSSFFANRRKAKNREMLCKKHLSKKWRLPKDLHRDTKKISAMKADMKLFQDEFRNNLDNFDFF